jgi:chromosome segregation ATPase
MSQSETYMLLILGFASATFLSLIAGRIAWKLAFRLGARQAQRNMPSSMIELHTDRDRMRAEHAMMAKKLELRLDDIKMRMAEQTAEVSRHRNRFEILKQDVATRDAMLKDRDAELALLRDKVSYLEASLEEKVQEIATLNEALSDEEDDEEPAAPVVTAAVPTQDRLKNRIRDLVSLSKQISKQKKGASLELEQPVAMTETEIIVKPADSMILELVAQSESLEEKIVETERAATELQDELKRLDQVWTETPPEVTPEPAPEVPTAEEEKPKSAITNVISLAQRIRSLHKDVTN